MSRAGVLFDLLSWPVCLACGGPLDDGHLCSERFCAVCRAGWSARPTAFSLGRGARVAAVWEYEGTARRLIVRAKEEPHGPCWRLLALALEGLIPPREGPRPVVAAPPSSGRRGWHLAAVLARELRRRRGLPRGPRLRRRVRRPPQASLDGRSRRTNLRFSMEARPMPGARAPTAVWLVDDVLTTGATARECARALRAVGVRRLGVLVLARSLPGRRRG